MLMVGRGREARVHYMDGTFRLLSGGDFVRCAVTGVEIPLSELRYWSVDHQEAYASPEIAARRRTSLQIAI